MTQPIKRFLILSRTQDVPGDTANMNPPAKAGNWVQDRIPGLGRFPRASEQLSLEPDY